ncbi:MAG: hypothetical protein QW292_07280 [Candidatus Parvarchaeota archaeon]
MTGEGKRSLAITREDQGKMHELKAIEGKYHLYIAMDARDKSRKRRVKKTTPPGLIDPNRDIQKEET